MSREETRLRMAADMNYRNYCNTFNLHYFKAYLKILSELSSLRNAINTTQAEAV